MLLSILALSTTPYAAASAQEQEQFTLESELMKGWPEQQNSSSSESFGFSENGPLARNPQKGIKIGSSGPQKPELKTTQDVLANKKAILNLIKKKFSRKKLQNMQEESANDLKNVKQQGAHLEALKKMIEELSEILSPLSKKPDEEISLILSTLENDTDFISTIQPILTLMINFINELNNFAKERNSYTQNSDQDNALTMAIEFLNNPLNFESKAHNINKADPTFTKKATTLANLASIAFGLTEPESIKSTPSKKLTKSTPSKTAAAKELDANQLNALFRSTRRNFNTTPHAGIPLDTVSQIVKQADAGNVTAKNILQFLTSAKAKKPLNLEAIRKGLNTTP